MTIESRIVLNHNAIEKRAQRMAWQIYEELHAEDEVYIAGILENGYVLAKLLAKYLKEISNLNIEVLGLSIDKKRPFATEAIMNPVADLRDKNVIVVDDVLNTGRTFIAAMIPVIVQGPKRIKTAVLANRDHKEFPIAADYVGISLATTLEEHITFSVDTSGMMEVVLD